MNSKRDSLDPVLLRRMEGASKADKKNFLASFLREQREYRRTYAAQGQQEMELWTAVATPSKAETASKHNHTPPSYEPLSQIGFNTPVLKPRNCQAEMVTHCGDPSKTHKFIEGGTQTGRARDLPSTNLIPPSDSLHDYRRTRSSKAALASEAATKKRTKKRIACDDHSDEDQVARLEERKERKRTRRAIVNPARDEIVVGSGDTYTTAKGKKGRGKGCKKREKKNTEKTPAAFALMHGFVATNVGKHRITMKAPLSVGVFGRGKASDKAIVREGNAKNRNAFYEDLFLQGTRKKEPPGKARERSTLSLTSSSSVSAGDPSQAGENASDTDVVPSLKKDEKGRCVSEIWDIESQISEESKARTLLLDTGVCGWNVLTASPPVARKGQSLASPPSAGERCYRSSPSLRPSQSASQCAWNEHRDIAPDPSAVSRSKYFRQEQTEALVASKDLANKEPLLNIGPRLRSSTRLPSPWSGGEASAQMSRNTEEQLPPTRNHTPTTQRTTLAQGCCMGSPELHASADEHLSEHSTAQDGTYVTHNYFSECLIAADITQGDCAETYGARAFSESRSMRSEAGSDLESVAYVASVHSRGNRNEARIDAHWTIDDSIPVGALYDVNDIGFRDDDDDGDAYPCDGQLAFFDQGLADGAAQTDASHDRASAPSDDFPGDGYALAIQRPDLDQEERLALTSTYNIPFSAAGDTADRDEESSPMGSSWCERHDVSSGGDQPCALVCRSDDDAIESSVAMTNSDQQLSFGEGRALLMGITQACVTRYAGAGRVSRAEADVARSLQDHWTPYQPL
ncbi:hypothetical protein HDZ31DRAFT_47193 [Schizophyllum fasciatum]